MAKRRSGRGEVQRTVLCRSGVQRTVLCRSSIGGGAENSSLQAFIEGVQRTVLCRSSTGGGAENGSLQAVAAAHDGTGGPPFCL